MTETAIIEGCRNQEQTAQKELVITFSGYLFTIARRYMIDHSSAQDILQQGFVKILKNIDQFDDQKGNLKSWMSRIIINEALRNQKKFSHNDINIDDLIVEPFSEPISLSQLKAEDLLSLIKTLPPQYKVVFNLNVIDGYTHKEIAEQLNISPSTSRSNLTRAKNILKNQILDQEKKQQWQKII